MSYLVLARKYRPRSFSAMVGQQHVVQALANALTQQRLHHAYLFTGTRGVGKTTVSRILAKALNCTGPDGLGGITAQPCGACAACRDIDAGRFVDYVELDAASNRGVEEITQLLDQAVYKPVLGRFKVYMVDEVHMLSNHAFNAMLKTLEEPPEYLKFVLATTDPQKVPPTVLSRCLQFNLRPMAAATVQEHLATVLGDESIDAQPGALRLLARAARGSMRDALSLADQAIAFGAGTLTEEGVRQMLGAVESSRAVGLLDSLQSGNGAGLLAHVDDLRGHGLSAAGALEEMAELLQQMAVVQAVPSAAADLQDSADVPRLAASMAPDHTALLYSMCLHGRAELALAPDEYGGLVMVLLRMLAFDPRSGSQPTDAGGSAVASPARAPAASPRPAIALQLPKFAKAAVPVSTARTGARLSSRRAEAAPTDVSAAASAPAERPTEVSAGFRNSEPSAGESAVPPWLDAPEFDSAPAGGADSTAVAHQPSGGEPVHEAPPSAVVRNGTEPIPRRLRPTELGSRWAAAVDALIACGSIGALSRELAWQAQCVEITEPGAGEDAPAVWRIRVEREMLRAPAHSERLQNALSGWLGARLKLIVESGRTDDTPALRALAEREQRQREAEKIIAEDPVVQSLLSQYRTARIIPGSIQPE